MVCPCCGCVTDEDCCSTGWRYTCNGVTSPPFENIEDCRANAQACPSVPKPPCFCGELEECCPDGTCAPIEECPP